MARRALMWFRADLRVGDNAALSEAAAWVGGGDAKEEAEENGGIVGVFVICPGQWREHDWGGVRVDFVLRTLRELSASLAKKNIPLVIETADRFKDVPRVMAGLAERCGCTGVFFNREYEVNEARRDEAVTATLEKAGIECFAFNDQCVIAPGTVRTNEGKAYSVFTPFKKAWITTCEDGGGVMVRAEVRKQVEVMGNGKGQIAEGTVDTGVPEAVKGFESKVDPKLWPAGEKAAMKQLEEFAEERIARYKSDRDSPAIEGTSGLSPYLAVGAISARQCMARAVEANKGQLDGSLVGPSMWISELIWREFYRHVLVAWPRVCMGRAFKPETDSIEWSYDKKAFSAWCEGRTGVPIVDAAMRCLNETGWMHNRLRMIVAMYLTKDLFIDWRWGERYFMQRLIDGDLASNNGGWQWSASTGTDAAPYFRIYNPVSQSRRHDPKGEFIRKWVPELADLSDDDIHDPSELPELARAGIDYPEPIADHSEARERVMGAFKSLRE